MELINKPMYSDGDPAFQPQGHPRRVLNAVMSRIKGALANEQSFEVFANFAPRNDLYPVGAIPIDNGDIVLFTIERTGTSYAVGPHLAHAGEIGIISSDGNYRTVCRGHASDADRQFGFKLGYQIEGVWKRNTLGELIVCWWDNHNPIRYLNLDDLPFTLDVNSRINTGSASLSQLFPNADVPTFTLEGTNDSGGQLHSGVYYYAAAYETDEGTVGNAFGISGPVPVTDTLKSDGYNTYEGAEPDTATTKSVSITYSGVDTQFAYMIIYAIACINGTYTVNKVARLSINSSTTLRYTHTGFEQEDELSLEELLVDSVSYSSAKTGTVINGNLYLANLAARDELGWQKYANNVKVDYVVDTADNLDLNIDDSGAASIDNNHKDEYTVVTKRLFMPDEVYALYLAPILLDGSYGYAYHIPGRRAQVIDKAWNTGGGNYQETTDIDTLVAAYDGSPYPSQAHLTNAQAVSGTAKYYQLYDTSGNTISTGLGRSNLGFWQNENETYPTTADWEIWDSGGYTGDHIKGANVRHHRMPSLRTVGTSWYDPANYEVRAVKLRLSQIYVPASIAAQIQGFELFYAKRTEENSIVKGQSLLFFTAGTAGARTTGGNATNNGAVSMTKTKFRHHDFNLLKTKPNLDFDYITNQSELRANFFEYVDTPGAPGTLQMHVPIYGAGPTVNAVADNDYIRKISNLDYIPNNITTGSIVNDASEEFLYGEITNGSPGDLSLTIAVYQLGTNNNLITHRSYLTNICKWKTDMYSSFDEQDLASTGTRVAVSGAGTYTFDSFGGDTFVSDYSIRLTTTLTDNVHIGYTFPCFSTTNIGLRHTGVEAYEINPKAISTAAWLARPNYESNYFGYNSDYSKVNDLNPVSIYPKDFADLATRFYGRIAKNAGGTTENAGEPWRRFNANDYMDLSPNFGQIWKIEAVADQLIINTENSVLRTIGSERLRTSTVEVYLGTGEIFEVSPRVISPSKLGYGGTRSQNACALTRYGYFFVDAEQGKVFLLSDRLQEISAQGQMQFFRDNTRFELRDQVNRLLRDIHGASTEYEFTYYDNPASPYGTGILAGWDDRYRRLILTRKDYTIVTEAKFKGYYDAGTIYAADDIVLLDGLLWRSSGGSGTGNLSLAHLAGSLFNNLSYTISYSPEDEGWVSFHEYTPCFMTSTRNELYASYCMYDITSAFNNLYRFSLENDYGKYFNQSVTKTLKIDVVARAAGRTIRLDALNALTEVVNSSGVNRRDKSFTHTMVYNSHQCSGRNTETRFTTSRNAEGEWRFNNFRDLVSDTTTAFLDSEYNPVSANVDSNKQWFKRGRFIDRYHIFRLEYDNVDGYAIYLHAVDPNIILSNR